jgi:site-specific DNA-methyltransferase (adenine-specific)
MKNTLYTGDNLHFLYRLNTDSIDLIYLDPPFNSKRTYSAPIGSKAAGTSFKDIWSWADIDEELLEGILIGHPCLVGFIRNIEEIHGKPMMTYVTYMAQRLIELHRVLKDTGSLYLHCDSTASHYLKVVLDKIFGAENFFNEVIWCYKTGGASPRKFAKKHDTILVYSKSDKPTFNTHKEKSYMGIGYKTGNKNVILHSDEFINILGPHTLVNMKDWWEIPMIATSNKTERTGYPTQKPLALLDRIIKASSNEDDIVLDPFCGCATTCVAAQHNKRRWIAIDIEEKAVEVLFDRLKNDAGLLSDFVHTHELPKRDDISIEAPSKNIKERLYNNQEAKCNSCNSAFDMRNLEIDHIIPNSKGGSDTEGNYQLLCENCSRIKSNRPMEYLRQKSATSSQGQGQG